ncbi:hypothetical protein Dimus_012628 [Dionaea muscipula]
MYVTLAFMDMEVRKKIEGRQAQSLKFDLECLRSIIFDHILIGRELPQLWSHLKTLMMENKFPRNYKFVRDHMALWHWQRKYDFFSLLWLRMHAEFSNKGTIWTESTMQEKIFNAVDKMEYDDDWRIKIPNDIPLARVCDRKQARTSAFQLVRCIRILYPHFMDSVYG